MPELPDVTVYIECIERRTVGQLLEGVRVRSPFLLRSVDPPISEAHGKVVRELRRLGKRIVFGLDGDLFLVLHLMIAGRLHWKDRGANPPGGKRGLAAFDFPTGALVLTEAGTKKRASLYVVRGEEGLLAHDPGGIDVMAASCAAFSERLTSANHTLKRALTDPRLFSGIGNAYSDEILHRARLSPVRWTNRLAPEEIERLHAATQETLRVWLERLRSDVEHGEGFPEKVTAFRPDMAVHGRYGQPCPDCGSPVQRIVFASNETNYCARCQTDGKLLADRALSRLLKKDWPRTLEELEQVRGMETASGARVSGPGAEKRSRRRRG